MDREVVPHQRTLFGVKHGVRLAHHVPRNNETGHQKVWTAIVSGPMTVRGLQHGVEVSCLPGRLRCRLGLGIFRGRGLTGCHVRTDHLSTEYLIATVGIDRRIETRRSATACHFLHETLVYRSRRRVLLASCRGEELPQSSTRAGTTATTVGGIALGPTVPRPHLPSGWFARHSELDFIISTTTTAATLITDNAKSFQRDIVRIIGNGTSPLHPALGCHVLVGIGRDVVPLRHSSDLVLSRPTRMTDAKRYHVIEEQSTEVGGSGADAIG
mmetsp:Transcript_17525/g.50150  ORF Transcript_17525/g.50150 Transcript_17525/m.50150 type:complete len:270 (+) Transcript_17525:1941-2750(+)